MIMRVTKIVMVREYYDSERDDISETFNERLDDEAFDWADQETLKVVEKSVVENVFD